jgi:hypothetical protein
MRADPYLGGDGRTKLTFGYFPSLYFLYIYSIDYLPVDVDIHCSVVPMHL